MVYASIAAACWVAFIVYWVVSSARVKSDVTAAAPWWIGILLRIGAALLVILLARRTGVRALIAASRQYFSYANPAIGSVGAVLCVAGVAVAIWARACLGANWSSRPSVKVGHELVTSGPYGLVRHPIYTGMLMGTLGTALDAGIIGLAIFVVVAAFLVRRIPVEERLMLQLFPDQYADYRGRTKALIPYLV